MEGYKKLTTFILATVICDLTVQFVKQWINPKSRTTDQMTQAARSGKQNIAEGYTMQSLEGYIKLLGVADGSIKELGADYEDYLRQNHLVIWDKDHPKIRAFREFRAVWKSSNSPNSPNLPNNPEEAANMLLTFCQMEGFLLKRQIESLKEKFTKEGGFRENLFKKRIDFKKARQGFIRLTKRTLVMYLVGVLILSGTGVGYLFFYPKPTSAAWFNDNWAYRKAISTTIASNSSDISNLQMLLTVDTSTGANGIGSGKMQSSCQDLRFTNTI